jgi:hypothetical protein
VNTTRPVVTQITDVIPSKIEFEKIPEIEVPTVDDMLEEMDRNDALRKPDKM